ncbi:MAG: GNAT family N-acetyltransferase [Anaerolineales bacterium]|nr:GNAT family N-acetyltransferase [Anaerolineales bacterium]
MLDQIAKYRQIVTLADGTRVLFRPLVKEDKAALVALFEPIGPDDHKLMRNDVRNRELVGAWADNIDYKRVLPLVAVVNDRIVGDATLHFRAGPGRHLADVRIFMSKEFRRRGLGTVMLRALLDIARKCGIQQLVAEVVADQVKVISAFKVLGFEQRATYPDYFMMPDGETHDVVVLILSLGHKHEEF